MKEHWKIIEDYPNYEVSNLGTVRNIKTGCVLRPIVDDYLRVDLCKDGKHKSKRIHRLVAEAFIPNPENKRTVNHISGDKTDNRVENLEWATHSENMKHAFRTGLNHHGGGLPKQKVRCIETGQIFESQLHAAKYFGVCQGSIRSSIHRGCKVLKKYHFELI